MAKTGKIDINKLAEFSAPTAWMRIDPTIEARLSGKAEIRERIDGCERFCWHIQDEGFKKQVNNCRKYLRAALAEYASIEEAAKLDLEDVPNLVVGSMATPVLIIYATLDFPSIFSSANSLSFASSIHNC